MLTCTSSRRDCLASILFFATKEGFEERRLGTDPGMAVLNWLRGFFLCCPQLRAAAWRLDIGFQPGGLSRTVFSVDSLLFQRLFHQDVVAISLPSFG